MNAVAVRIQQGVASIAGSEWPLRVRVGLAAGEPVADGDDLFGLAVNLASRVTEVARPGSVLATREMHDAASERYAWSDAGEWRLKGFKRQVRLYRARRLDSSE